MVKNEQDIIEPFIRHNLGFIDYMVVLDNGSHDETRRILCALEREFSGLVIADDPTFGFSQSDRMRRMLALTQTVFRADYVFFLDADEFIDAPSRTELETVLATIPGGGVGLVPWKTFVLPPGGVAEAQCDVPRTMAWRRAEERPLFKKSILRLDGNYYSDLQPLQGNHDVATTSGRDLPRVDLPGIALAHFPLRSHEQLISKAAIGWMAYLAIDPDARDRGQAFQWRQLFERIRDGVSIGDQELAQLSADYAQGPEVGQRAPNAIVPAEPPRAYNRKYSTGTFADPLRLLLYTWEQSLVPARPLVTLDRPQCGLRESVTGTTAIDAEWHWDHVFLDIPPFRYAIEKWRPESVLDIGCGIGGYLALAKALGTQTVFGIDGLPPVATVLGPQEYRPHDLATPLDLGRRFDLVICVEVAEHVSPAQTAILYETIVRHAKDQVIFSAAEIGQPGHGHINCRSFADWLALWRAHGWVPALAPTLAMRSLATLSWFRRNLVVLRRGKLEDALEDTRELLEIGAREFAWYAQAPGIREHAFREMLPDTIGS